MNRRASSIDGERAGVVSARSIVVAVLGFAGLALVLTVGPSHPIPAAPAAVASASVGAPESLGQALAHAPAHPTTASIVSSVNSALRGAVDTPSVLSQPASTNYPLALSTASSPEKICADASLSCSASAGVARVTLQAQAAVNPTPYWPNVQVAFVVETTAYDGSYYHYFGYPGTDPCANANSRQGLPCEESNGVPFFLANAGQIASAIQAANPHSKVTFSLVDFFGTNCGDWDDCGDNSEYDVDISQFIPANEFGPAVQETFQDGHFGGGFIQIVGLDDNFLHSPSITALYGTIIGSGLDWSLNTHHVIVLMGSTAPRAPGYAENYYVSPFDSCCAGTQANGWTCEPSYRFAYSSSPNCEGWVSSTDGNRNDSIAGLARSSPSCTESVGHVCTVDVIDYWTTPTDAESQGWPLHPSYVSHTQNGPGAPRVIENVDHVLEAGCDLAAATGGSWDGPSYWSCPNGQAGSLEYVAHGSYNHPNTNNPSLMAALRQISFGPVYSTLVANSTGAPMFRYLPHGNIRIAPNPQVQVSCETPLGYLRSCQLVPENITAAGVHGFAWNWSTIPSQNALYVGDVWTVSFDVYAIGPPFFSLVPVLACTTTDCRAGGSGPVDGQYTSATYRLPGNTSKANETIVQSFPLAQVQVEVSAVADLPPPAPPPIPPTPPGFPVGVGTPLLLGNPVATANTVGVTNASLQAAAAGFLGAGFVRVSMKNRPIAMKVAAKSGAIESKFDSGLRQGNGAGVGRFE